MASYFDYFRDTIQKKEEAQTDEIRGTCDSMCPLEEAKLRETEKLIHVLEVLGSEKKLVKSYSRSAADSHMAVPHLLRPYPVLTKTVQYLLLDVSRRVDVPQNVVYDFINDRLRAVRQDMTIQRLPPEECVQLLEPMVRFYVYYGYILSNIPLKDFDPVLNKKYLLECTKWCLNCYDNIIQRSDKDVIDRLTNFLCKLDMNSELKLSCDRVLVESIYILSNLDSIHPYYRFHRLSKNLRREPKLQLAYEIAAANLQGNFVRVCRLMERLCCLTYCAVYFSLPNIQRHALQVLSHGYHNKRLTVPSPVIAKWLRFSGAKEAATTCNHYGLKVEGDAVRFDKNDFNINANLHQLTTQDLKTKFKIENIRHIYVDE